MRTQETYVAHIISSERVRLTYYVIEYFNIMQFSSAVSDNNTEPAIIWWSRRHKKKGQGKIKHWVHPFFHDNLNSGSYIVSKELNQDPDSFISREIPSQAESILSRLA
jgi:hypothetical protein